MAPLSFYRRSLIQMRDGDMWQVTSAGSDGKPLTTFEEYCRDRWDMGRTYAHYMIESARVLDNVHNCEQKPATESQARPLTKLSTPELQQEAWQKVHHTTQEGALSEHSKHLKTERILA